jgi:putative membrane protein
VSTGPEGPRVPHGADGPPLAPDAAVERPNKRLSPLTPLVRSFIFVVVVVASTWDDLLRGDLGPIAWGLLAVLVAGAVFGAASWVRTKYWIEAEELRVDTGVISRQSRRIRVDRLQGIDIVQPFVARLFGLAELRMDVAGAGVGEGSLAYVTLAEAQQLRETLLARRDAVRAGRGEEGGPSAGARSVLPAASPVAGPAGAPVGAPAGSRVGPLGRPDPPEREIARLDLGTLLLSLLLSPETGALVLAALVVGGSFLAFGHLGALASVVPVVIGFALAQLRRLSAFYGFTVSQSPSGLQVRRGLFERNVQTIALARVQGVVVSEPLLWRGFGWARLDVAVAGYATSTAGDGKPSASTVMPVADRALVLALARTLLAEAGAPDPDEVVLTPPPERSRWAAPVGRRFMAGGVGGHLVVSREGILNRRTHVVPHARVQSLQVHQGPWQRRLRLADLQVDSPPGPVRARLRHRDAAQARELLDLENAAARRVRVAPGRHGPAPLTRSR